MTLSRRCFMSHGSGLALLGMLPSYGCTESNTLGLIKDPDGVIDLPKSFSYQVISRTAEPMSDGYVTPARPDGMAAFPGERPGQVILMRNHEVDYGETTGGAYTIDKAPTKAYRKDQLGGVSRLVYDTKTKKLVSHNLVLTGTTRNCSGGPSPWGWLTCEEAFKDHHGFVFLCDPAAANLAEPERIDAYGRFMHEAVAIDPATHVAYLTEDRSNGCLYRFVPADKNKPFGKGRFEALGIKDQPGVDTTTGFKPLEPLAATWIDCPEQTPTKDTLRINAVKAGAARINRGEGIWYQDGKIYFTATRGGDQHLGQVWQYDIKGSTLRLLYQSTDDLRMNMPDNITCHPDGRLFICEDGRSGSVAHIRILDQSKQVHTFARNRFSDSEFAGVCFAPDGSTMFVNMQEDGLTLAITGPFAQYKLV